MKIVKIDTCNGTWEVRRKLLEAGYPAIINGGSFRAKIALKVGKRWKLKTRTIEFTEPNCDCCRGCVEMHVS